MRITEHDNLNTISKAHGNRLFDTTKTGEGATRPSQSDDASTDGIDLGSQSGLLSQARTAGSDDRAARIEQLRALVASGQYHVDTAALSRSLVDSALNGY